MKWFLSHSLQTRLIFLMTCMLLILSISSFGIIRFVLDTNQKNSENNFQNYAHILEYGIAAQFYERYGDIQAFAVNPIVSSLNANQIPKALNDYVRLYGIYDVILVVDKEGRFIASSTVDTDGKPVDTSLLMKENFKNTNWFQAVLNNQTTDDKNKNFAGTFVEDPSFDSIVEKVYRKKSYGSGFSSAIKNDQGEIIGVITNRANAKWFANEFVTTFQLMKKQGLESMELALLDKTGTILFEYDPVAMKSDGLEFNEQVLGKLNLKNNGVEGAKLATQGQKGFVISKHFRKQIDQASSYSPVDEDKFVNSLGWSVLVRENMDVVYRTNIIAKRFFYITFVIILGFSFLLALYFSKSLATSITRIADNLTNTSKIISSESEKIASSSLQLSSSVSSTASAVDETVSAATEVTEMVGRSAELADESSKEIEKMIDLSSSGQISIKNMNSAVQAIADSSHKIIDQIDKGNLEIEKIIGLIDEISTKTKVIDDIVFQTRLLSFNASVEAARAGENGKGFAVVAEEVGKLAQMSGQQSKEIADLLSTRTVEIKNIILHSKQATEVLATEVNAKIEVGIETADNCLEAFERISQQCDQISKMSKEISSSSKEQSIGVRQIADAMSSIGVATNESSQISNQSSETSVLIKEESQHLNQQIQYLTKLVHGKNESAQL